MAENNKKKMLKELVTKLRTGVSPSEVKERFRQVLEGVTLIEISRIEQELLSEGLPREEIQRLCDIHLAVFREELEKQKLDIPLGHPISILMEEHKTMLKLAEKLGIISNQVQQVTDPRYLGDEIHNLGHIAGDFMDAEKHYLREENVLFPFLEKHGITEPPRIMWTEHNKIRDRKKQLRSLVENFQAVGLPSFKRQLDEISRALSKILSGHFFKENNVLFPAALRVVTDEEWKRVRKESDEIGYCCFTPQRLTAIPETEEAKKQEIKAASISERMLQFETGNLSKEEFEAILDTLPVDITFVDKEDAVRYFSKGEDRIFVRTKAVLGRKVQQCHPQKSVHIVNEILESFKKGEKDVAEFWIQMNTRLIHIKYFAVRDKKGKYLGTMEVTQDLTDIKKIKGEKRLLDWKA